jgi:hypothetical protein
MTGEGEGILSKSIASKHGKFKGHDLNFLLKFVLLLLRVENQTSGSTAYEK